MLIVWHIQSGIVSSILVFVPQIQEVISIQQSSMHGRKTEYGEIIFKNILLTMMVYLPTKKENIQMNQNLYSRRYMYMYYGRTQL